MRGCAARALRRDTCIQLPLLPQALRHDMRAAPAPTVDGMADFRLAAACRRTRTGATSCGGTCGEAHAKRQRARGRANLALCIPFEDPVTAVRPSVSPTVEICGGEAETAAGGLGLGCVRPVGAVARGLPEPLGASE